MDVFGSLLQHFSGVAFYIFSFALVISVVVFVHEFGHYFVAKLCGVKIESFSIGFGPEIFGFNDRSGTRWKVSWFPLGGYVKMFGDTNAASFPSGEEVELTAEEQAVSFQAKKLYQRFLIVLAGPVANFLLAALIFIFLFMVRGYQSFEPVVGKVIEGSAAQSAGLLPGDVLLSIDDRAIHRFEDIKEILNSYKSGMLNLSYQRGNKNFTVKFKPEVVKKRFLFFFNSQRAVMGIVAGPESKFAQLSFSRALAQSAEETVFVIEYTLQSIKQMLFGERSTDEIGGPISIAKYSAQSLRGGSAMLAVFIAMISINLGVVNLLPIPLLDGGHILNYIIEAVIRKRVSRGVQKYTAILGAVVLISLTVFAIFNDMKHVFSDFVK